MSDTVIGQQVLNLLTNASATGAPFFWAGGEGEFEVDGTFGGATVTLQKFLAQSQTWVAVGTENTLTAAGMGAFKLGPCKLRALVAGGAPSGLNATATTTDRP